MDQRVKTPAEKLYDEYELRRQKALAMGGEAKLKERRDAGVLNARERIAALVDEGSFLESGLFATSVVESARDRSAGDGKVVGYAKIEGRDVAVVSNDFTVMGASSSATNGKKIGHMKRNATARGLPLVFLGESSGARMPDTMGARGMGTMLGGDPTQYMRTRETPWAGAVLGFCYGSSTWYTALSDFSGEANAAEAIAIDEIWRPGKKRGPHQDKVEDRKSRQKMRAKPQRREPPQRPPRRAEAAERKKLEDSPFAALAALKGRLSARQPQGS